MMALQVRPEPFIGVEVWTIRWELKDVEAPVFGQEALDGGRPVGLQTVPKDEQGPAGVAQQLGQKSDHLAGTDGAGMEPKVTLPAEPDGRQGGELGPIKAVPQDGGLAPRSPGLRHIGGQREARFVQEEERAPDLLALFFIAGQRVRSHCRAFRSSRSRARRSGRCQEKPSRRSRSQTWDRW